MNQERIVEIFQELQNPELKIEIQANATTMGPSYVVDVISRIYFAKEKISSLSEEVEKALSEAKNRERELVEQWDLRTDVVISSFDQEEKEGTDAATRKALARQKVENQYQAEKLDILTREGVQRPEKLPTLREEIVEAANEVETLRSLQKILKNRSDNLSRQDSAVRLQMKAIEVELQHLHGGGSLTNGNKRSTDFIPPKQSPDSLHGVSREELRGSEEFGELTREENTPP